MAKKINELALKSIFGEDTKNAWQDIENTKNKKIEEIRIDLIDPNPFQPRKHFDEKKIIELAASIKSQGLIQPIVLKKTKENRYFIIVGERRLRASKINNAHSIEAFITDLPGEKLEEVALVENLQREDLTVIETAEAYRSLKNHYQITDAELANKLGVTRATVTNILRFNKLPSIVKNALLVNKISMGQARPLISLAKTPQVLKQCFYKIINQKMTSSEAERYINKAKNVTNPITKKTKKEKTKSMTMHHMEDFLSSHLNTKVEITKHMLKISYANLSHLDEIFKKLNIKVK